MLCHGPRRDLRPLRSPYDKGPARRGTLLILRLLPTFRELYPLTDINPAPLQTGETIHPDL
ncbi:hypothetical protein GCM10010913_09090 [Paenibacillus aceti]|uniref:Uncharacterized protein n=1 Tax=Paenibacillus aceti TaxID=1820010 RepID=A0ABQ1VS80_9BACL|nr:hypothetical protein GCM10010913_09090 [Paenibacillus aceti]